jgi:hypothetical protein
MGCAESPASFGQINNRADPSPLYNSRAVNASGAGNQLDPEKAASCDIA